MDALLRMIQFNSQLFAIPELPSTSLMCHFDSLSKLNHSCVPNAILSLSIFSRPSTLSTSSIATTSVAKQSSSSANEHSATVSINVSASVVALRDIVPGEELCVSYVSQLCASLDHRHSLLEEGYLFDCNCPRCVLESTILHSKQTTKSSQYSFDFDTLELGNYQHIANQIKVTTNVSQKLLVLEQEHLKHLKNGLQTLFTLQQKLSKSSTSISSAPPLNKTIVVNVYRLHDAAMSLIDITMGLKSSVLTLNDSILCDTLTIRLIDILHQCWDLSYTSVQFYQISFFLVAATAAVRIISNIKGKQSGGGSGNGDADTKTALTNALILTQNGCTRLALITASDHCSQSASSIDGEGGSLFVNSEKRLLQCLQIIRAHMC